MAIFRFGGGGETKNMAKDNVNLYAESDRGIISDDPAAAIFFENSSTGNALRLQSPADASGIQLSSVSAPTTAIDVTVIGKTATGPAVRFQSAASLGSALEVGQTVIGSPTVATIIATNSAASGAFFEFRGFLASIASASSLARGVRVKFGDEYGFIPVYKGGVYT